MPDDASKQQTPSPLLDVIERSAFNDLVRTDDLDFHLPADLIAQHPPATRSASRLMHYRRDSQQLAHRTFSDLPTLLRPGDVMVFNDARVLPARFTLQKSTGGRIDGLFLREIEPGRWRVLLRDAGRLAMGTTLRFVDGNGERSLTLAARGDAGEYDVNLSTAEPPAAVLGEVGRMPLPPYIKRDAGAAETEDRDRYQTVYARSAGSVAAPTAGLHFDDSMLNRLDAMGVTRVMVTLHVGMGTFKPVSVENLSDHPMHAERYEVDAVAAAALNEAERAGRRIVAVGTTAARVLESHPQERPWSTGGGETSIFIFPPYRWKRVGALLTNFHLPRSTLVALVAGFIGLDQQRRLYAEAIADRYRFFSYGDAMFLE